MWGVQNTPENTGSPVLAPAPGSNQPLPRKSPKRERRPRIQGIPSQHLTHAKFGRRQPRRRTSPTPIREAAALSEQRRVRTHAIRAAASKPTPIKGGGSLSRRNITHAISGRRQSKPSSRHLTHRSLPLPGFRGQRRGSSVQEQTPAQSGEPSRVTRRVNRILNHKA